jgi:hypothetical protein
MVGVYVMRGSRVGWLQVQYGSEGRASKKMIDLIQTTTPQGGGSGVSLERSTVICIRDMTA